MAATHQSAVVLIPPAEVWPAIQAIRAQHDRQVRRWMPHVTLIYPFVPKTELGPVKADLRKRLAAVAPFEVTLARFGSFNHGRDGFTVFLEPEPRAGVVGLQDAVQRAVPELDGVRRHRGGFTPHLSVGQVRGRGALRELLGGLQASWKPLTFVATEVSLIARGVPPDDVFAVVDRVAFGGA